MSAGRADDAPGEGFDAGGAVRQLREAGFVAVSAAPTGDALAATGLLVRACRDAGTPFQARVRPKPGSDAPAADAVTVRVGDGESGDLALDGRERPASLDAHAVANALDSPAPALALAGAKAAGVHPGSEATGALLEAATEREVVERRPGVAVPTASLADGLAHSTRLRVPGSGDIEAVRTALAGLDLPDDLDADARRRVASLTAVEAATAPDASDRAAAAVEWSLRPYETPTGPFETLGGHADVLGAVARESPGVGVALALGGGREAALEAWRDHARGVHGLLDAATTARYDGVFVARAERAEPERLATAARLLRAFHASEPVALVVTEGAAAAAATDPARLRERLRAAAGGSGTVTGGPRRAGARFDGDVGEFVRAFRNGGADR